MRRLIQEGKQVIVFRETTGETRHGAQYLADALGLPAAAEALADLPAGDPLRPRGICARSWRMALPFTIHISIAKSVASSRNISGAAIRVCASSSRRQRLRWASIRRRLPS